MAHVCFVGAPRSGTSLICDMMYNFDSVDVYYELFHPKKLIIKDPQVERVFRKIAGPHGREPYQDLIKHVRRRPALTVEWIKNLKPETNHLSFKIFENHLARHIIDREMLRNPNFHFVLLRRGLFDSYISRQKARSLSVFASHDTSDVKIDFDINEYINFCRLTLRWYRWWHEKLAEHNRPIVTLSYGENGFDPKTLTESIQAALAKTGLELTVKDAIRGNRIKQDRATDYRDKINNYDEVVVELYRCGLVPAEIAAARAA